jgi:hypothetical protein
LLTVIGMGRDRERLATPGPAEALGTHQPLDGAACHPDVLPVELSPHLVGAVDEQVPGVHPPDLHHQLGVPAGPLRRWPLARHPVRVRGDLAAVLGEHPTDRLDPEPLPVSIDERDQRGDWRSSSAPKNAPPPSGSHSPDEAHGSPTRAPRCGPARRSSALAADRHQSRPAAPRWRNVSWLIDSFAARQRPSDWIPNVGAIDSRLMHLRPPSIRTVHATRRATGRSLSQSPCPADPIGTRLSDQRPSNR